jgi:hypothetical protein
VLHGVKGTTERRVLAEEYGSPVRFSEERAELAEGANIVLAGCGTAGGSSWRGARRFLEEEGLNPAKADYTPAWGRQT